MKVVMFYHSLVSDWNHGNAHFLRGVATELIKRGNIVEVWEQENSWSRMNLIADYGSDFREQLLKYYPTLSFHFYYEKTNLEKIVFDADVVIVHEWSDHQVVASLGEIRSRLGFKIYFHDTHHRTVTDIGNISKYDLSNFDGVIAFGKIIKDRYLESKWIHKAWTLHEAADTNIFFPHPDKVKEGDIVWIGNWGDEERSDEIRKYLINPVKELKLKCRVYGVRYPDFAIEELNDAGIEYGGWLPNYKVPEIFSKYKLTLHIPRAPYVKALKGIPTIRPFEALACGIPLISTYWEDSENLFSPGEDFIYANSNKEIKMLITEILNNHSLSNALSAHGLDTIISRHTCSHRVDQLYEIFKETGISEHY